MLKIAAPSPWKEIKCVCSKAKCRRAALAYITKELVKFQKGDLVVVDASTAAIKAGETSAALLRALHRKGVALYSRAALHAKVIVADDVAIIGSANMSASSDNGLVEASLVTDSPQAVSQLASFIEQLAAKSEKLSPGRLEQLAKIKVTKRRPWPIGVKRKKPKFSFGSNTWLVSVYEDDHTPDSDLKFATKISDEVAQETKTSSDAVTWTRITDGGAYALKSRPGDVVIQIWRRRSKDRRPEVVLKAVPVLRRERRGSTTFVFTPEPKGKRSKLPWAKFRAMMSRLGQRRVGVHTERVVPHDVADAIASAWKKA